MDAIDESALQTRNMLADSLAAFSLRNPGPPRIRRVREVLPGFDVAVWRQAADAGWFGLRLPEQCGGSELGVAELAVVMEGLGRNLAPEPVAACVVLAGGVLARCPESALRDRLLAGVISGALRPVLAWQDATDAATVAHEGRLTGAKRAVHGAAGADGFIVTALDGLYWVAGDAATPHLDLLVDGGYIGTLSLSGTRAKCLVAGDAALLLDAAIDEARLAVCAELVGVMDTALAITTEYIRTRRQFGVAIGSFQVLQHRMVDLWIQHRLCKAVLNRAIAAFDEGSRARAIAVSAAKARCSDAAMLITRQSIQLHGGMGYTDECDIGLCLKRAMVLASFLGNAAAQRRRYADLTLNNTPMACAA